MIGEILFIAHRMPFPPDRGDKIRSCNVLRRLARLAPVHVATFAEDEADEACEPRLAKLTASQCVVRRSKPLPLAGAEAMIKGSPVSLSAFDSKRLSGYIADVLKQRPIETIYVFSSQMGQYVPHEFAGRVVVDFVDVDSAKFAAYARQGRALRRWIDAREARLLRREEARLAERADVSLLISKEEAALFSAQLGAQRAKCDVRVLNNGIDTEIFNPAAVAEAPELAACPGPRLIFTGQMDYPPNTAAALRTIDKIMPLIRRRFPTATFHIVGRSPPPYLLARHGDHGCYVWGKVDDMRPWLKGADLALVALDIARGVQNKVLEAMAMAVPVVLTPQAATGIPATDGEHWRLADTDDALAIVAELLLLDPPRAAFMAECARSFVDQNLSWESALTALPEIVGLSDARRDAA